MFWTDINFKAKDVILIVGYLVTGIFFVSSIQSSLERQGEKIIEMQAQISEMKDEGKGNSKDNQIFLQSIQNQINTTTAQLMVLDQRVSFIEQQLDRR